MIRLAMHQRIHLGERILLSADDRHYLLDVMRRGVGDLVEALSDDGLVFRAEITANGELLVVDAVGRALSASRKITLFQALLKGDHFADVVERGTEAGIEAFVPIVTARSIPREVSPNKALRWRAIAKEASEQSRGAMIPEIVSVQGVTALSVPSDAEGYVLDPSAPQKPLWLDTNSAHIALVVGPEGGFTSDEYHDLYGRGFQPLSLGPRVYRAENAGAFAAVLFLQTAYATFGQDC